MSNKADHRVKELAMTDSRQIAAQKRLAMTDRRQIAAQKRLAMTDSIQIAIPCFAGTGATEARDDGSKADRRAWEVTVGPEAGLRCGTRPTKNPLPKLPDRLSTIQNHFATLRICLKSGEDCGGIMVTKCPLNQIQLLRI